MGHEDRAARPSPREGYEDFARENEDWDRKVKEALEDLDEFIEGEHPSETPAPAQQR